MIMRLLFDISVVGVVVISMLLFLFLLLLFLLLLLLLLLFFSSLSWSTYGTSDLGWFCVSSHNTNTFKTFLMALKDYLLTSFIGTYLHVPTCIAKFL